jgi:hypothetical protein
LASAAFAILFAILGGVDLFGSPKPFPSVTTVIALTGVAAFIGFVSLRRSASLGAR